MSLAVGLVPVEVTAPAEPDDHEGCLICTTSKTPMKAYRPHTLDGDCWCTYGANGEKFSVRSMCWVYTTFLRPRET